MALESLLNWCAGNDVHMDPRISICNDIDRGIHVVSKNEPIPPDITLVRIPKTAVLSVRSSSLSKHIPFALHGWDAQLGLSFALYSEILRGESSRWFGYLHSLPSVDLPIFWACDSPERQSGCIQSVDPEIDHSLLWLNGTEVLKRLNEQNEKGQTLSDVIKLYYRECVLPVLQRSDIHLLLREEPDFARFRRAFSLVSSRAFLLDAFHGLAMAPIADAFNHIIEHHVHIQSDFYVCPECGSLRECQHDDAHDSRTLSSSTDADHDLFYEMVSNADILPDEEIFNTYGEKLSNAELLMQYGFILDANDNDVVHFDETEIAHLFPSLCGNPVVPPLSDQIIASFTESFTASNLVSTHSLSNAGVSLFIDSDGRISAQLWIFIVQLLCKRTSPAGSLSWLSEDELIEAAAVQIHMENILQTTRSALVEKEFDEPAAQASPRAQDLLDLARTVVRLCEGRREMIGHPKFKDQDFGEILDTIPEDKRRLQLAVSVAMSERSILDSCRFGWIDLIDAFNLTDDEDDEGPIC